MSLSSFAFLKKIEIYNRITDSIDREVMGLPWPNPTDKLQSYHKSD